MSDSAEGASEVAAGPPASDTGTTASPAKRPRVLSKQGMEKEVARSGSVGRVIVVTNENVLEVVGGKGDLGFGVPQGRPGNNHPETRRNMLVQTLQQGGSTVVGAGRATDLKAAELVHTAGFVRYMGTAFSRWRSELSEDPCYLLPGTTAAAPGLVPFHCVKSEEPRSEGLNAEMACYSSDVETPIFANTADTLREDLGVIWHSVQHVQSQPQGVAYALTAHPGHHAGPTYSSGFCYLNNAAIACCLLQEAGVEAALLDVDFHGGNGSFDCVARLRQKGGGFWFRSLNCARAYPWVDMGDSGIEIAPGTGWESGYGAALAGALASLPPSTAALVVSLGYDTLRTDPEAGKRAGMGLGLEPEDFRPMGMALARACPKVLVVQEGGYDLPNLQRAAVALMDGLGASADGLGASAD